MRPIRRAREIIGSALSREQLPEDPVAGPKGETVFGSICQWLFQPEDLPYDPVLPKHGKGFFGTLLACESLPQDAEESDRS